MRGQRSQPADQLLSPGPYIPLFRVHTVEGQVLLGAGLLAGQEVNPGEVHAVVQHHADAQRDKHLLQNPERHPDGERLLPEWQQVPADHPDNLLVLAENLPVLLLDRVAGPENLHQ